MTAQSFERLHYRGELMNMASNPLADFLKTKEGITPFRLATNNWRGYVGEWKIEKNKLYLTRLEGNLNLEKLFPGQTKVFANWFSGEVRAPQGEVISSIHMGYGSIYEKDLMLVFEHGTLVREYEIDNTSHSKLNDDEIFIREEWFDSISWQNRAFLRKLDGQSTRDIDNQGLKSYLNRVISPQLAIAGHLDDQKIIRNVCFQILALLRFLPQKDRDHKVELLKAAFGFDLEITAGFKSTADVYARFQRKLDFRKRWLWFLPNPKRPIAEWKDNHK